MILDKAVQVKTLADNELDSDKEGYVTKLSSLRCNIQPASDETVVLHEGNFGETFTMWTPVTASGVVTGDVITTISGMGVGDEFAVRGRKDWNMPPMPHYEFVLFKRK